MNDQDNNDFESAFRDFDDAWHNFVIAVAESLKLDVFCSWLNKKLS